MQTSRLISIVVPAFNEERNVEPLYVALQSCVRSPFEVIFVDDGSRDETAAAVRRLRACGAPVRLVRFARNFGHQAALFAGLEAAHGAAVITLDCDLQHPPELLPRMIDAWQSGSKIVQMVRLETRDAGLLKSASSDLFYKFLNVLAETPIVRGAADYQLLDREVVEAVLKFRDRHPFLRGLVSWLGFPSTKIEYVAPERRSGTSGYTLRKMLQLAVDAITGLSSKPLRMSFYVGLVTAVFCVIYAGTAVVALLAGRTVEGWTSVIVMVLFLGAVQLVSVGILGEYVARVYEQTRGIPRWVAVERDDFLPLSSGQIIPGAQPSRVSDQTYVG